MKAKRLLVIGLVLAGVGFVFILARLFASREPVYQGKRVSVWFKEYAFATNLVMPTVRYPVAGQGIIVQRMPDGRAAVVSSPSKNLQSQIVWFQSLPPESAPAWIALQALGSNAVPHLVYRLRSGRMDRIYERGFTNLPSALQRRLPNPARKKWYRAQALRAITGLGDAARDASPALLELLQRPDPSLRREAIRALHSIHTDLHLITGTLLQLGAQQRYADVTAIAWETGWEGSELSPLLGKILQSPDVALRRNAISLLERVGRDAAPALEQVTAALKDPDGEVRYLAARSLESIGTNSPEVIAALRASLQDENVMVQNVARRVLRKLEPDVVQPDPADAPKSD